MFCFVAYISFAQTNKDSIEVTILETGKTHIKSFYYEGVIFNWNENDTLNWNPTIDEIEIVETYIKNLFEKNAIKNIDFYGTSTAFRISAIISSEVMLFASAS